MTISIPKFIEQVIPQFRIFLKLAHTRFAADFAFLFWAVDMYFSALDIISSSAGELIKMAESLLAYCT